MSRRWSASRVPAWLAPPAPARRLALVRIAVGLYACAWLVITAPDLLARAGFAMARFEPVGLATWTGPVAPAAVAGVLIVAGLLGVAMVLGVGYRVLAPAFAVGLLWLLSYRNSWGHLSHGEHLLVLHVGVLALAPAADALRLRARGPEPADDGRYGWPLRLLVLVTVSTYAIAGLAKLRGGGWAWLSGETVRLHVAHEALRVGMVGGLVSPLATWILPHAWLFAVMAWATVAIELGAPVALFGGRVRTAWICGVWGMHLAIVAVMGIGFPYPLSGVAFVAFVPVERGWGAVGRWRVRRSPRWARSERTRR
jgi:Vitamin K-dependent gamma-carboxylase